MADSEPSASTARATRTWIVGAVALALFVVVVALVIVSIPRGGPTLRSTFTVVSPAGGHKNEKAAVNLSLTIDSLEATAGGIHARLIAEPGPALPAEGATVFNSSGSDPTLVVRRDQLDQERSVFLSSESGDVSDYPFDSYRVPIAILVLAGTDTSLSQAKTRQVLPFRIDGASAAAGIVVTATTRTERDNVQRVTLNIRRSLVSRDWVLAMMAIYWALAILAAGITYLVLRRRRPMETRLLAWLSALVFALIAFRNAAPGAPPVGTFLDYYAVFEAVGIVAVSLVTLMIYYLVSSRERLAAG